MTSTSARLLGATALEAAEQDAHRSSGAASKAHGDMLLVATWLRQAAGAKDARLRRTALRLARTTLGADALRRGCSYEDRAARSDIDVIRLLAQHAEHAGLLSTARSLLEGAHQLAEKPLDRARVLSARARNSRKMGQLDLSEAQSASVLQIARRIDSDELRARGNLNLGALAQTRGNFVAMKRFVLSGIRVAERARLSRLAASGYIGLGVHAARRGDFDDAVTSLWRAFENSRGSKEVAQEVLVNLAQVFLDAGHPAEALFVGDVALRTATSVHEKLPALGSVALASAALGNRKVTHRACAEVRRLARAGHQPREVAGALLDCAVALATLGADAPSAAMYDRAMALANAHGFHDLTFVPRPKPTRAPEYDFAPAVARLIQSLGELEPRALAGARP